MPDVSATNPFIELLAAHDVVVADGGMGTLLFERGLEPSSCPELFNVDRPDVIRDIHREYIDAGADVILTNTFGGNGVRLARFGLEGRVGELNAAGAAIARSAADAANRPIAVAGSVGPTGELPEPYGTLTVEQARSAFAEQTAALSRAGVDVLWIETMSSIEEVAVAYEAASTTGLPVVTTMSFDTHGRTMMGVGAADLGEWAVGRSQVPAAIGANCGIGPDDVVEAAAALSDAAPGIPVVAKANCGIPVMVDGGFEYPLHPDDMPPYADAAISAGARIIGACCGSRPGHIATIRATIDARR